MSGYMGKDPYDYKPTPAQLEEIERMKQLHRPGPRNRHEKRAAEAKLKKRMRARAKNVSAAIRTGRAEL